MRPGGARAEIPLLELDEVDQALAELLSREELTGQELINAVKIQSHSGQHLVIEDSIPEPWRQRFAAASVGSTRLAAGPYFGDFEKFVMSWNDEMAHLVAREEYPPVPANRSIRRPAKSPCEPSE